MTGFVYAIAAGDKVKIGWSADPLRRLVKVQSDNANQCVLVGAVEATTEQEAEAHELLSPWRLSGEWFDLNARAVAAFCSMLPAFHVPKVQKRVSSVGAPGLAAYLEAKRLRPSSFAASLGVPASTITRLLRGERSPSFETARKIFFGTGGVVGEGAYRARAAA